MKNRLWSAVALVALAGTLVLLSPGTSEAQRRGGGGGGNRGGFSIGIGSPYSGGFYASYGNRPYYGGYGGYGLGGYGYGGYPYGYGYGRGVNIGIGTGYYGGYGYSNYGYGYSPSYYSGGSYTYPSYAYNPPTVDYQSFYPPDSGYSQQTNNSATVRVMVPADAELWFDGSATQQRGPMREFQTPPLAPDRTFTYQIRARWTQNGQPMDQTRQVQVQANRMAVVDFNSPAPQQVQKQQQPPQPD